jgi:hypothetical protein
LYSNSSWLECPANLDTFRNNRHCNYLASGIRIRTSLFYARKNIEHTLLLTLIRLAKDENDIVFIRLIALKYIKFEKKPISIQSYFLIDQLKNSLFSSRNKLFTDDFNVLRKVPKNQGQNLLLAFLYRIKNLPFTFSDDKPERDKIL